MLSTLVPLLVGVSTAAAALPVTQLLAGPNLAADADVRMPFVGLGTGDHSPNPESTCGWHCNITSAWLKLGAQLQPGAVQRLDGADSYGDEVGVALGVQKAGAARGAYWITSKVGRWSPSPVCPPPPR